MDPPLVGRGNAPWRLGGSRTLAAAFFPIRPNVCRPAEGDMLVTRATLSLYSGYTMTALADLRAVVALSRRGGGYRCRSRAATSRWPLCWCRPGHGTKRSSTHAPDWGSWWTRDSRRCTHSAGRSSGPSSPTAASGQPWRRPWPWPWDAAILLGSIEAARHGQIAFAAIAEARQDPARVIGALQTLPDTVPMLARLAFWPPLITALIDDGRLDRAEDQITELVQAATARGLSMEARVLGLRARLAAARGRVRPGAQLLRGSPPWLRIRLPRDGTDAAPPRVRPGAAGAGGGGQTGRGTPSARRVTFSTPSTPSRSQNGSRPDSPSTGARTSERSRIAYCAPQPHRS